MLPHSFPFLHQFLISPTKINFGGQKILEIFVRIVHSCAQHSLTNYLTITQIITLIPSLAFIAQYGRLSFY